MYISGNIALHPAFRCPDAPPGAIWAAFACDYPHFKRTDSLSKAQAHPRFLATRPCGACNYLEAECVAAEPGWTERLWEVYEYKCPACGMFTVYSYFQ